MATAKLILPEPVVLPDVVELTLSVEEAKVLRVLLGYGVRGEGQDREIINQIWYALLSAGVPLTRSNFSGLILYNNYKEEGD